MKNCFVFLCDHIILLSDLPLVFSYSAFLTFFPPAITAGTLEESAAVSPRRYSTGVRVLVMMWRKSGGWEVLLVRWRFVSSDRVFSSADETDTWKDDVDERGT